MAAIFLCVTRVGFYILQHLHNRFSFLSNPLRVFLENRELEVDNPNLLILPNQDILSPDIAMQHPECMNRIKRLKDDFLTFRREIRSWQRRSLTVVNQWKNRVIHQDIRRLMRDRSRYECSREGWAYICPRGTEDGDRYSLRCPDQWCRLSNHPTILPPTSFAQVAIVQSNSYDPVDSLASTARIAG